MLLGSVIGILNWIKYFSVPSNLEFLVYITFSEDSFASHCATSSPLKKLAHAQVSM